MSPQRQYRRTIVVTALAYGALATLVIELTRRTGGVALVWPATGVLVAMLATLRPRRWGKVLATCFVVSFAVTWMLRHSLLAAFGFAFANILEAAVTAFLLHRFNVLRNMLYDANSVLRFALLGGIAGPLLTAPIAALTAWMAFGMAPLKTLFDWSLGHGIGTLVVTPLALMAVVPELTASRRRPGPSELAWFVGLIFMVAAVAVFTFAQDSLPLLFLPALPVMVATVRLGRLGSAASILAVAIPGGAFTVAGHGPLHLPGADASSALQIYQLYIATLFLISLPTAAMLTRLRKLTALLREREAVLRLLADNSSDVLLSVDVTGEVRFVSPSVYKLIGQHPAALIGRNAMALVEPDHRPMAHRAHVEALASPDTSVMVEYQARRHDGSIAWFETITRAVSDDDGGIAGVVSAIRDVSHRKAVERQLRMAADSDVLTGLPNRRPFLAALDEAVARADRQSATVAMLDLDYFKRINDQHGHAAGDAALVTIAEMFTRELRGEDMVARLGGEEFAILLHGVDLTAGEATCERLRLAIEAQPILAPGTAIFHLTASFGLAEVTAGSSAEAIMEAADRALYAAKGAGRNQLSIAA